MPVRDRASEWWPRCRNWRARIHAVALRRSPSEWRDPHPDPPRAGEAGVGGRGVSARFRRRHLDPLPLAGRAGGGGARACVSDASRFATSSLVPRVDARARCAAASPPERRSFELSGGGCNPVDEPMPLSPRLIAGLSSSASAGPIGCTSGRCAFDFGVLPGFFGLSGFFAIRRIWDESGRTEKGKSPQEETPMNSLLKRLILLAAFGAGVLHCQQVSAQSKDAEPATRAANDAFVKSLPFSDRADFDDVKRGFIATLPDGVIAGVGGKPAWDTRPYAFLQNDDGAGDRQSEPVAAGAAQRRQRSLQSDRARLSGARPRSRQSHHHRGRHAA